MKSYLDYNIPILNTSNLPTYPVPDRVETLQHFLKWVQPLLKEEEYLETTSLVKDFIESHDSIKLHKKLEDLGTKDNDSWISDYWLKSYLKNRDPFVPHINVPIVYENSSFQDFPVLEKASALIYGVAHSYLDFRNNPSGQYQVANKIYSTDQFHGVLGSINHIQRDINRYYINSGFSTNVVIIYRNHIYSMEVMDESNKICNPREIYKTIESIYNETGSPIFPNINFVTAEPNKDIAGNYLAQILEDRNNRDNYQKIKDSIFVLNLDEDSPGTPLEELYSTCMDSQNFNRWHGKGLEFSISKNGVISFVMDHSFSDASTSVYLINKINGFTEDIVFSQTGHGLSYDELHFNLDKEISLKLVKSFEDYKTTMDSFTPSYVNLESLSRDKLKNNGILSGDGFFHLALQAAQQMTFSNIYNTYIAVDMRHYFKGRTEANRPVTAESVKFVQELLKPELDLLSQKELLKNALDAHYNRTISSRNGKGVNRYLYILEKLYDDFKDELDIEDRPALFDSLAFETINHNNISTTSFGHENLKYSYFPPVVEGGLGIYYIVSDKSFAIITSFNEDVDKMKEFSRNLKLCVDKMLDIISYKS